jgi:hypothetical protein
MSAFLLSVVLLQPPAEPALPSLWYGTWTGPLKILAEKGDPQEVPMSLEVGPLGDTGRYAFRITYGPPDMARVRDYELVPKKGRPGRFEIDEKNGIRLDAKLVGNTLFAAFQVGDTLIQSRYERFGDVLRVEMTAYATKDSTTSKPTGGGAEVKAFPLVSVQTAELKRVPEKK